MTEQPTRHLFRTSQLEEADGPGLNPTGNRTMGEIIAARFSRRGFLKGSLAATAITATVSPMAMLAAGRAHAEGRVEGSAFDFPEVTAGVDADHHVADGYDADVLLRWGDRVFADSPAFDPLNQSEAAQERQFGYNSDFVGFLPLDAADRALLVVNHEYTSEHLMFPGIVTVADGEISVADATEARVNIEMAAHGGTIIEIRRADGKWQPVLDGALNRRITAKTPMQISGPAAGHARLQTAADPTGTRVLGTINNCAGGVTPWGTYIMAEENIHGYFTGALPEGHAEARNYERMGIPEDSYAWGRFHDRFDVSKEPNEPNRFGWIVEVDVMDPDSTPKKRTALGRFKHENAEVVIAPDGRAVVYMGDDQANDYIYKFVSEGKYDAADPAANRDLLDRGTLYVAKFDNGATDGDFKGVGEWVALVQGQNGLDAAAGFASQADVLINTRGAADLVGATKMDRPEWIAANPKKVGEVFCALTNNSGRTVTDDANPRAANRYGQIVRWNEAGDDATALTFEWDLFLVAGNPIAYTDRTDLRSGSSVITADNTFNSPDGIGFDHDGRLWIQTDGNFSNVNDYQGQGNNQMLVADLDTGELQRFFVGPSGCEVTGLAFTPDMKTMFVNIQHPGELGSHPNKPAGYGDNEIANDPLAFSKWPEASGGRPRSATVVVRKADGGKLLS